MDAFGNIILDGYSEKFINFSYCGLTTEYIIFDTYFDTYFDTLYNCVSISLMILMSVGFSVCFVANFVHKPLLLSNKDVEFFFEDMIPYEEKYMEDYVKLMDGEDEEEYMEDYHDDDEDDDDEDDEDCDDGEDCDDDEDGVCDKIDEEDDEDGEDGEDEIDDEIDDEIEEVRDLNGLFIKDVTPAGDVMIFYDVGLETFMYYSERREIPFKYLETLARLFVCTYKCGEIYIDYIAEYRKAQEKVKDAKEAKKNQTEKECEEKIKRRDESVFATFKKQKIKEEKVSSVIITEKCNKYIYKGKIKDYELDEAKKKNMNNDNECSGKKISFSEFKRRKMELID